jgi:chaperone BCS1
MNTVEIRSVDRAVFLKYLSDHMKIQENVSSIKCFFAHLAYHDDEKECIFAPGLGEFEWKEDGETYRITIHEEGTPQTAVSGIEYFIRMRVQHPDMECLSKFISKALTYIRPTKDQEINIYYSRAKGYWEHFNTTYAQSIDRIYLNPDVKASIIAKIDSFVASKQRYIDFGRPYKINFLLAGVPGAGKTSLVKALALKYKRNVKVLNFSKCLTDENLMSLMSEVVNDEIILMEDIDAFFVNRETNGTNVSFSALLNIMDGTMMKGNGTMMFLTANNASCLDKALIRPGRIDHIVRFDYPTINEIREAFRDITECGDAKMFRDFYAKIQGLQISMSSIIDFLFRYPTSYMENITELLSQNEIRREICESNTMEKLYM